MTFCPGLVVHQSSLRFRRFGRTAAHASGMYLLLSPCFHCVVNVREFHCVINVRENSFATTCCCDAGPAAPVAAQLFARFARDADDVKPFAHYQPGLRLAAYSFQNLKLLMTE